jgi:hypothetical protein
MANPTGEDSVQFGVYLDAVQALAALKDLRANAGSMDEIFDRMGKAMLEFSQKSGLSLSATESLFKRVINSANELRTTLATFPEMQNIIGQNPALVALSQVQSPFTTTTTISASLSDIADEEQKLITSSQEIGLTLGEGFRSATARAKELQAGMELVNKGAHEFDANMNKAAEAAALLATYNKQGLAAFDFTKAQNYATNVRSLMTGISNISKETGQSIQQVGKYIEQNFQNIPKVAITDAIKGLNDELKGVEANSQKAVRGLDAVRIALGAIVAMIVFRVIEAFQQMFTSAIQNSRELEVNLYSLLNAEKKLSEQGIDITPKGLDEFIKGIEKLVPILSKAQVTELVGSVANLTAPLGFTEKQIGELSKSIAILYVQNKALGRSFDEVRERVINAFLSGRVSVGINQLGVKITDTTVMLEAIRLELVKDEEEFRNLTGETESHVKSLAMLSLLTKSTAKDEENLRKYFVTSDSALEELNKQWNNFVVLIGQGARPTLIGLAKLLIVILNLLIPLGEASLKLGANILSLMTIFQAFIQGSLGNLIEKFGSLKEVFLAIRDEISVSMGLDALSKALDTPTGSADNLTDSLDKLKEALGNVNVNDLLKDLENLQKKMEELQEEFNLKMNRLAQDFVTDQFRAAEDYQRQVAQTIQDFNDKRHDAEMKYRLQEQEAEARFQENMRQLREKFLFNLEDALRERDARQVLRLIREYKMEKENMTREEQLRKESAARQHAEEMARLKREEAERLAQLEEEYRIKQQRAIEDFNLRMQREKEDHERDMEQIREQIQDRLKEFAKQIADELGLKADGAQKIYDVLNAYYGKGGLFEALYDYANGVASARAQELLNTLAAVAGQYQQFLGGLGGSTLPKPPKPPSEGGGLGGSTNPRPPKDQGLGDLLSNSLASNVRGATGPVNFPTSTTNGSGIGGNLSMRIMLSNGLVAEIIDQSLEGVSVVIEEVQRNR